jgi:hypothetical protein
MSCGQYTESSAGRIKVVTSGTRPTGVDRYVGQRIFESDTGRELLYDGSGWVIMSEPAQTWTPTWLNITVGNGTVAGWSRRSDGMCDCAVTLTCGSTTAIGTGTPAGIYAPYGFAADNWFWDQFSGRCNDVSAGQVFSGTVGVYSVPSGILALYADVASGSYTTLANLTATVPYTWAAGDKLFFGGRYKMASRYS